MPPNKYACNVKKMRIVFALSAIAILFAIVCLVLAVAAGGQLAPIPPPSTGLNALLPSYQSNNPPMQQGGFLLSPNRTKMLLFTDNLYTIDLLPSASTNPVLWSANNGIFPYASSFLTLSANATLVVQTLDSEGTLQTLWSNEFETQNTDNYLLQISDAGQLQILTSNLNLVWFAK